MFPTWRALDPNEGAVWWSLCRVKGWGPMGRTDERIPHANEMRRYAAAFVARVTAGNQLPLDYSAASLRVVDFLVDGLRKGGADRDQASGALFGLGAYVGEVLVRRAGAEWVDFDADQRAYFGQSVGVRMPDGRV